MPRSDPTEVCLEQLAELRRQPELDSEQIQGFLDNRSAHVVAKAAEVTSQHELADLVPDLARSFHRLLESPEKSDPGCVGKAAIARALIDLEADEVELLLIGSCHVQLEAVWGGKVDTAAELRGLCGLGLTACGYPIALLELARLLADPEARTRQLAARAIGHLAAPGCEELLRFKALSGDAESDVLYECYVGLLELSGARSAHFLFERLEGDDEAAAQAALALGQSRRPEALGPLQLALEKARLDSSRQILLNAISLLRLEPALAFLYHRVSKDGERDALQALEALALHAHNDSVVAQLRQTLEARSESGKLAQRFIELFGGGSTLVESRARTEKGANRPQQGEME